VILENIPLGALCSVFRLPRISIPWSACTFPSNLARWLHEDMVPVSVEWFHVDLDLCDRYRNYKYWWGFDGAVAETVFVVICLFNWYDVSGQAPRVRRGTRDGKNNHCLR
jgi:hypothetical protein